ncbi:MAG: TonB-dependent receptor [Gammaproteobacteria bacterium]|nr:TonB-dependent receptor [Gammaproteobacteria bacterium]MDP2142233.1 TonB-dependent receptor [Gammaproteobacteria bacterium]MDP2347882.1 TonB-dependent receptor [Gammaproteobacteria bacterium]
MSVKNAVGWVFYGGLVVTQMEFSAAQTVPEEIVVTSSGLEETIPMDLSRYGNRVEIITAAEIEQQGFVDIAQALQMLVPGLHVAPKNGAFDYFDASLQGSRNQEILWLIDGVRITNRLYNGTSPLDTIPSHMVDRIEILKGGQGIFYGTQSVGGVINVVTKSFQRHSDGAVAASINSNNGYVANGYYRTGTGLHQFVFYGSKDKSGGYKPYRSEDIQPSATDRYRGYKVNVVGAKYAFDLSERSRISLQYQRTENTLDFLTPFANRATFNEREEDIITAKYDLQFSESIGLYFKVYYHNWDTLYTRIHNVVGSGGTLTGAIRVRDDETYWGYEDYGMNAMLKLNLVEGFEYVLGLDHQNFSGEDDVWRIADQEERVDAAFAQIRTTESLFENTALAFGIRHNRASNVDSATVWNISGQHDSNKNLYVRASLGTSFRLPDAEMLFLNEYYDDDSDGVPDDQWFAIGNPNLKPEQSRNINLGIGGTAGKTSYELIGFKRKITDYIASYVPLVIAGVEGESFVNTGDEIEVEGMELITALSMGRGWSVNLSFTYTSAELNDSGIQLTEIPKTEGKFKLGYQPSGRPWGVALALNYVGDVNTRRAQTRGNYTVADVSAYYQLGSEWRHRVVLRVENVGDKVYTTRVDSGTRDVGGSYLYRSIGTGRTLHLGYSYQF